MSREPRTEGLLRELAPQVLGILVRRHGRFDACEDAVQEALLAAARQWPDEGVPGNPRGWLLTVATRRLLDELRSEQSRRRREEADAQLVPAAGRAAPAPHEVTPPSDDSLALLFLCCHPAITPASQIALTLRAVGGLTTVEIAAAFLVPEASMAQRISRAKQRIRDAGATFGTPPESPDDERLAAVLHVLYLVFNEGYAASSGPSLQRVGLSREAIRLARQIRAALPGDGEVAGLLALMLLTHARRDARTGADDTLVPLVEQDRSRWDPDAIAEGIALIEASLGTARLGPYQLQAAIAAVHAEAPSAEATDWIEILALYTLLERVAPNPMIRLNRAVALGMARGARAGLRLLDTLAGDRRVASHHRFEAVRAHLLERDGSLTAARDAFRDAARLTSSSPERRYLEAQAARLAERCSR